jgi:hypothetical protein
MIDFRKDLIVRWPAAKAAHVPLLKRAGIQAILLREADAEVSQACRNAGIETALEASLQTVKLSQLPEKDPGSYVSLASGLWPGVSRAANKRNSPDDETASASAEPWVDSNGYWIHYLRALYPNSAPVLAYEANEASGIRDGRVVGFETLEIAYAEARAAGGNYILSVEPSYREALLKGDPAAGTAWERLGRTASWFRLNDTLFRSPAQPAITALVEPGRATAEIANLLFRRNGSPRLASASAPPAPDPGILALVTTGLRTVSPEIAIRLLAHAERGSTVVTDDPSPQAWWRGARGLREVRKQEDRVFYSLGKGTIVAYNKRVANPSEHALDVIDIVTHPRRPVRIWNSFTVIALASNIGVLHLLSYASGGGRRGGGNGSEIQVRMQGHFAKARLLQPGEAPKELENAKRGSTTEVFVPQFDRVATVVFG